MSLWAKQIEREAAVQRQPASPPNDIVTPESSLVSQQTRLDEDRIVFIDGLIAKGVFKKVEHGKVPKVWVGPEFYLLPFETKQSFVGVVYAYHFEGSHDADVVVLKDYYSGQEVGSFGKAYGGLRMKR